MTTTTDQVPEPGTVNWPLLDEALDYIRAHPEEHDQETWVCGTTACLAGHLVRIADGLSYEELADFQHGTGVFGAGGTREKEWPELPTISDRARVLVGDNDLADELFYLTSFAVVERVVENRRRRDALERAGA